jgi:Trk K+ transport system NAD-binding subunit
VRRLKKAGASRVISPVRQGAIAVAEAIVHPHTAEFFGSCADDDAGVVFAEVEITNGSPIDGLTIKECGMAHPKLAFVAVKTADHKTQVRPPADYPLTAGHVLIVAGERDPVTKLETLALERRAA